MFAEINICLDYNLFLLLEFGKTKQDKETVIKQGIHMTLQFNLATGKVNLNEIVYRLKELRDPLMLNIFLGIPICYRIR